MTWYPVEANTRGFVAQHPEEVHDIADESFFSIFVLNHLQARHWVKVDYSIMLHRIHAPMILQCQDDGCSLSIKDGAVIQESFRQLAASCLTILEMAIDDCCCPHSFIKLQWRLHHVVLQHHDRHRIWTEPLLFWYRVVSFITCCYNVAWEHGSGPTVCHPRRIDDLEGRQTVCPVVLKVDIQGPVVFLRFQRVWESRQQLTLTERGAHWQSCFRTQARKLCFRVAGMTCL